MAQRITGRTCERYMSEVKIVNEAQRGDFPLVEAADSQSAFESTAISISTGSNQGLLVPRKESLPSPPTVIQ